MSAARKYIQPYLYKVFNETQHNNLIFNPDKTTCILLTPYPALYNRYKVQGTTWGKQKETVVATYKAVMRPTLEYVPSIWSPMASLTNINKLQVMQNAVLRACTGCTHGTNIHICMTKTTSFPYRNIYNYMHRKSDKKHNIHHIHYTDTLHRTLLNG